MYDWMIFTAAVRTRPDVVDLDAHLSAGVEAVRAHPNIERATYRHHPRTHTVDFAVRVTRSVAAHVDAIVAHRALHEALERAGFGDIRLPPYSPVPVQLRFDRSPTWVRSR